MPQLTNLNDVVLQLEEGTQKGSVKWIPEEGDTESFSAGFDSGGDLTGLVPLLGELRFHRRFLDEVSAIEDALAEAIVAAQA